MHAQQQTEDREKETKKPAGLKLVAKYGYGLDQAARLFVNLLFALAIFRYKYEPCWVASHVCVVFLYVSLNCRRRRDLPPVLRQRLGHAAVSLVAILAAIFFYNFAPGVSGWIVISVLLALTAAAYFAYDVVLFHQEEEAAAILVR